MKLDKCHCDGAGFCEIYQRQMDAAGVNWCNHTSKEKRENYKQINNPQEEKKIQQPLSNYINPTNFYDELPKQKSDIAVCTIPANDSAMQQLDITRESIESYAKRCGADYIELSGDQCPEFPMYNKYRLHQVTSKYEKTLYLDCDIVIKDTCPNLFKTTPNNKISAFNEYHLFDFYHYNDKISDWQVDIKKQIKKSKKDNGISINGGVMMIPKSLCELYKQPSNPYLKSWCFDQSLISLKLNDENFHELEETFNLELISYNFWKKVNTAHIVHACGLKSCESRLQILKKLAKNETLKQKDFVAPKLSWSGVTLEKLWNEYSATSKNTSKDNNDSNNLCFLKNQKKKLIISVATEEYEDLIDIVLPSFKQYANKCQSDLIILKGTKEDWWGLEKFRIYNFVKQYDRSLFIDIDIIIKEKSPDLFEIVPENSVGIFNEYSYQGKHLQDKAVKRKSVVNSVFLNDEIEIIEKFHKENKMVLNTGVVLCSKKHANIWHPVYKPFFKYHESEQMIIESRIISNEFNIYELDEKFNTQYWTPNFADNKKNGYFIHYSGAQFTNKNKSKKDLIEYEKNTIT